MAAKMLLQAPLAAFSLSSNRTSLMNPIFPWLGIAVLILCGWAIIKKY